MAVLDPVIGHWFKRPGRAMFEVVAIDEDGETVEIQQFDGTIDQIDVDTWTKLSLIEVAAPEDWSGSVDMDPEDYVGVTDNEQPTGYHDPLAFLDNI